MSPFIIPAKKSISSPRGSQKRRKLKKDKNQTKELTGEIGEVRLEQKGIKEGQRQVQHKIKTIEAECDELRRETALIIQQSATTQLRLALMFQILQARQNNDFSKAAQLAQALRYSSSEWNSTNNWKPLSALGPRGH
ncbi:hypothetical protein DITRI_Ditri12bG0007300 [Diplodiscus trichospermus]